MAQQFKTYLQESALAPATVVNYMADLRAFLRWHKQEHDSRTSPFDLTASAVESYCVYLSEERTHAPATVNRRLQTLRKFYGFAVDRGWTDANPAEEVALLEEVVSERSRFLTEKDVTRLLAAVKRGRRRWVCRDLAIMQVFLRGGLKLGELTDLRMSDVQLDSDAPHLKVRGTGGAESLERVVPVDDELCAVLEEYVQSRQAAPGVEHFFANRDGNPLSTRSVQRLLHQYAASADLDGLTTQALRYHYAVGAYEANDDLETVARLLGHRHLATTIRYLRPTLPAGAGRLGGDDGSRPGSESPQWEEPAPLRADAPCGRQAGTR